MTTGVAAGHEMDYARAVDVADLESVLSGASEVSWSSFLDWEEVDRLIADSGLSTTQC